jgi:hypothetical protein
MSEKRLAKWFAWRVLRFKIYTHVTLALMEALKVGVNKERSKFADITKAILKRDEAKTPMVAPPAAAAAPSGMTLAEQQEASWRHNLEIAEIVTAAMGGKDLRKEKEILPQINTDKEDKAAEEEEKARAEAGN